MKTVPILSVSLVFAYISLSKSETRPALTILKLIHFLQINVHLVDHLDKYIEALDTKLGVINEALVDLATYHIQFENDKLGIISSPVGSYSLIHHMQSDWTHWQFFLQEDPGKDEIKYLISKTKYLPVEEDITEVCQAIFSIINAYDLLPRDIARGSFLGMQYKYSLSPLDCLRMADHSTAIRDFEKSTQWLQVAISILENPNYTKPLSALPHLNTADLYLKLAEVYVRQRNWHTALETVEISLESNPRNANLLRMQEHLSFQILLDPPSSMDFNNGNNKQGFQRSKSLYCFYHARNGSVNPFLAPNKAEIIFIDPLSVIYHE